MDSQTQYDSLYNEMKDLLAEKIPDYDKVKKCGENFFKIKRSFPADLRFRIWEVLLDISECEENEFDSIINSEIPFESRDFYQDLKRILNGIEEGQREVFKDQLLKITSAYCVKYGVEYWQGMCNIVEAILRIEPQPPLNRIFVFLSTFLQTFMVNPIIHELIYFQHICEILRLLLQYHDPELSCHLKSYETDRNIFINIFSMPLFISLFSHDVCHPLLLSIWDQYILYRNPVVHVFTILSHLIHNRSELLVNEQTESDIGSYLLVKIKQLPFENDTPKRIKGNESSTDNHKTDTNDPTIITSLVNEGLELMKKTPPGFLHCINNIVFEKIGNTKNTLESYIKMNCIIVSPSEVITSLFSKTEKNSHCLNYIFLDTRPYEEYKKGHLINSRNINENTLQNDQRMMFLVQRIKTYHRRSHIIILSNVKENGMDQVCEHLVNILVKSGCTHISKGLGGYARIVERLTQSTPNIDLFITRDDTDAKEEPWEQDKPANQKMKKLDGKYLLKYKCWMNIPSTVSFVCKRIHIFHHDGKKEYKCSVEKKMLLSDDHFIVIDIDNCPEADYAFIELMYTYKSIAAVNAVHKDFICISVMVKDEKKLLWYYVPNRDECIEEIKNRMK